MRDQRRERVYVLPSLCDLKEKSPSVLFFFFFNDTATTEIYTLSLHDALPIDPDGLYRSTVLPGFRLDTAWLWRSEEHTSELQSRVHLIGRLLLQKKQ